jgi:hypothetical protein
METTDLGEVTSTFRTSRTQMIVLFVVAILLVGAAVFLHSIDDRGGNLMPVTLIVIGGAVYFLGWGANLALSVIQVRELGVSLRFLIRRIDVPFDQIESVGLRQRTHHGLPGSYSGIWLKRRDGRVLNFQLESDAPQACEEIVKGMNRSAQGSL